MVTNVRVTNVLVTKRWSQTSRSQTSGSQTSGSQTSWSQTSAHLISPLHCRFDKTVHPRSFTFKGKIIGKKGHIRVGSKTFNAPPESFVQDFLCPFKPQSLLQELQSRESLKLRSYLLFSLAWSLVDFISPLRCRLIRLSTPGPSPSKERSMEKKFL